MRFIIIHNLTEAGKKGTIRTHMASFLKDLRSVKTRALTPKERNVAIRSHLRSYMKGRRK